MKVFSKEMFIKTHGRDMYLKCAEWVDKCDGKPVVNGKCDWYMISDDWCIDVPDPVEDAAKKEREDLWATLNAFDWKPALEAEKKPAPQAINCRCVCLTDKPAKHPRYKIIIECGSDHTFAYMYVDDNLVKMESAKRHPADKFNWRIGAQTAFDRLWKKKKKPAVREVTRHAEPGEYIKIVNSCGCSKDEYKNGDILKVVCADRDLWPVTPGVAFYKNEFLKYAYPYEYVVLEGYKPET